MNNNLPQLFALTPIDQTEVLQEGWYFCTDNEVRLFQHGKWAHDFDSVNTHYLRPLPAGSVSINNDLFLEIKGTLMAIESASACNASKQLATELLTKLDQMGK